MSKYFDWRIDSDKKVNNLLWLREYDNGTIKVVREHDGVWQWDDEKYKRVDKHEPNIIANSNHDVTSTCLGEAAIKAWKANGSPSKEPLKTKEYIADIFMAPLSVKAHLEHGEGKCTTTEVLTDMGVEIAE
jgi:hypothetical protein